MHYTAAILQSYRAGDTHGRRGAQLANGATRIDFQTDPSRYRHWKLSVDGDVATLTMDVEENAGLFEGYQLKMNSYDLGVDIELADAVERLRFEHPAVKVVLMRSRKDRIFCAGANIRMLAGSAHAHKVNFCKFTNETPNGLEDSSENSRQRFLAVVNGTGLCTWDLAKNIHWEVLLLFGGGLALAQGIQKSGLATKVVSILNGVNTMPIFISLFILFTIIVILSEIASNVATASIILPIVAIMELPTGIDREQLMIGATLIASVGFALPIATAPNAIGFATETFHSKDMLKAGLLLDLICIIFLVLINTLL